MEEQYKKLSPLVDFILQSGGSEVTVVGYERTHFTGKGHPNLMEIPHPCGVGPVWFITNVRGQVNQLLESFKVPEKEYGKYHATVEEFYAIEVEGREDEALMRCLLVTYLHKRKQEGYDLKILCKIGQIVFLLQRGRRELFG